MTIVNQPYWDISLVKRLERLAGKIALFGMVAPISVGYGLIEPGSTNSRPDGVAIMSYRQNGIVVSETVVESSAAIQHGFIYAEIGSGVKTGIAIANPAASTITVSFSYADADGKALGQSSVSLPPASQIARFLDDAPFSLGTPVRAVLTFDASAPVYITALRGLVNERSEFILSTLPIIETNPTAGPLLIPHFADGGGWSTQTVLMNPTNQAMRGSIQFFNHETQGVTTVVIYSIAPGGSYRFQTLGTEPDTQVGSVWIIPSSDTGVPAAFGVFSFRHDGVTVTEAAMRAVNGVTSYRLYVENSDAVQTGVVIANPSASPITVSLEARTLTGAQTGLTAFLTIPGRGQVAQFLGQMRGFEKIGSGFRGMLRVSTTAASGIAVAGVRGRYNERGDFLTATLPAIDEFASSLRPDRAFPHYVEGAGYTTEFVLFGGNPSSAPAGVVRLFDQSGHLISAW